MLARNWLGQRMHFHRLKRREFIALLGSAAAWPLAAGAQQRERVRKVGMLIGGADEGIYLSRLAAFRRTLQELGWVEGSLQFDLRWGGAADMARMAAMAAELVQARPDVLLVGTTAALLPMQKATQTIPIVFVQVSDPLGRGIVASLARPTGNVTGFSNLELSLAGKWLQLMKEIAPDVRRVSVMISTTNVVSPDWYRAFDQAAPSLGIEVAAAPIHERADIIRIIETAARGAPHSGLIVPGDGTVETPFARGAILALASTYRLPVVFGLREFVHDGGLLAYGIDQIDPFRRAAGYIDRILKGEKPADLPVQQPTKFELAINLKTAKALGLVVPDKLIATADEVIE
jgi:putative ABC transport system substrate-binding protein